MARMVMLISSGVWQTAAFLQKLNHPLSAESRHACFAEISFLATLSAVRVDRRAPCP